MDASPSSPSVEGASCYFRSPPGKKKTRTTLTRGCLTAPLVLDQDARVHDDDNARGACFLRGGLMLDAQLHPNDFGANANRAVYCRRNFGWPAKNIHDLDFLGDIFKS